MKITLKKMLPLLAVIVLAAAIILKYYGDNTPEDGVPTDKMTYRTNPHTGDKVSLLGFGCMRFPMKMNAEGTGKEIDQDSVNKLVDYAIAHGVNYFDGAPVYIDGNCETAMGIALSRHPRNKYFVATKMSNFRNTIPTRELSIERYHKSMELLQVDYIDYYLLHSIGGGGMESFKERFIDNGILEFLQEERKAGRIRNLGFSYHGDIAVFDYLLSLDYQWDFAQIQLNYLDWQHAADATGRNTDAEYLYSELVKRNVPAVIMEPLRGGALARISAMSTRILNGIDSSLNPAAWAFRFAGSPEHALTVLSGMNTIQHLQENIITYSPLTPLNDREYAALEQVTNITLNAAFIPCTECQYCMPCPVDVDIPKVFALYNSIVSIEDSTIGEESVNYRKAKQAFLDEYDRNLTTLANASSCIGCGKCKKECPQNINIPEQLKNVASFAEKLKTSK
ncbi:aldo/keto reductase [Bacteroidia bacterium]|nr:aldo/keto reductase [Bacteroidia bacterium]